MMVNIVCICMTKWLNCPLSNYVYIWFKSDFRHKSFCNALTVKFYFFLKRALRYHADLMPTI